MTGTHPGTSRDEHHPGMNGNPHAPSPLYPAPVAGSSPLRIGLLLDLPHVPAWVERVVEGIQGSGFCRIELVVVDSGRSGTRAVWPHKFLHQVYSEIDTRLRRGPRSAFLERDPAPFLADAIWMHVVPMLEDGHARLADADAEKIRAANLDVLLRFGFPEELARGLAPDARYGVWSYSHTNRPETPGDSRLFREIRDDAPVSTSELWQWLPTRSAPQLLYHSYGSTHPHSLEIGQQSACWKASSFVLRCLRKLAMTGRLAHAVPQSQAPKLQAVPGTLEMGRFLARNFTRQTRAFARNRASVEHWSIAWRRGRQIDPGRPDFAGAQRLPCPRGHFYADPFLIRYEGKDWLFLEDYDYAAGKADIAALPFDANGPAGTARTILQLDEHLSYPFVFEWNGQACMIPEIGDMGGPIRLFRARRFPDDWEVVGELLSGHRAVDATLHEHDGRWYLFANICETPGGSENDELFLFHAESPLGQFLPHPQNPIVSDVRFARPAGRIFRHADRWIRPSQDCAGGYGRAVVFNEITELNPTRYSERPLGRLASGPQSRAIGCHTYASLGDLEVVDLKHRRFRFSVGA